jgi:hypothetical protein
VVRRPALAAALSLTAALLLPVGVSSSAAPAARATSQVQQVSWSTGGHWRRGTLAGVRVHSGSLLLKTPRRTTVSGRAYDAGSWTSPWVAPGFGLTPLIPSWEAATSGDSLVRVEVRGLAPDGTASSWDTAAIWSQANPRVARHSMGSQTDDLARMNVDTWQAASSLAQWQVRVTLLRKAGSRLPVRLDRVGAVASALVQRGSTPTSTPGPGVGTVLAVPTYSQMTHAGHYPQWGGGGEAWCSPTSTAMVLAYYGAQPGLPPGIPAGHGDPWVDHTARMVYDHAYDGTGNWPFNTAYAATRVDGDAYVTRLRSLREAEDYIAAGVPLIASVAFGRGLLDGAPISASNGHLLVIVGFEADGDVVVNDPAGEDDGRVRRTYDRDQFEDVWINASGGVVYVIRG